MNFIIELILFTNLKKPDKFVNDCPFIFVNSWDSAKIRDSFYRRQKGVTSICKTSVPGHYFFKLKNRQEGNKQNKSLEYLRTEKWRRRIRDSNISIQGKGKTPFRKKYTL